MMSAHMLLYEGENKKFMFQNVKVLVEKFNTPHHLPNSKVIINHIECFVQISPAGLVLVAQPYYYYCHQGG